MGRGASECRGASQQETRVLSCGDLDQGPEKESASVWAHSLMDRQSSGGGGEIGAILAVDWVKIRSLNLTVWFKVSCCQMLVGEIP